MTDQKDTKDQPTEISDDDLDTAQGGGTFGNSLIRTSLPFPHAYAQSQSAFPTQWSWPAGTQTLFGNAGEDHIAPEAPDLPDGVDPRASSSSI